MKKTALIAVAASLFLVTASVNAQVDTTTKQPVTTETPVITETPVTPANPETPVTTERVSSDKWNNWDKSKYAMQPMPEPLTTEKIFPAIGTYQLTDKEGATSQVMLNIDPANKGIVWIEGLPQGKIKAILRKSPAVYKIPEQKIGEDMEAAAATADAGVDVKAADVKATAKTTTTTIPEGVLIYDRDANLLNVCIGCKYNVDDPATAFLPETEQQPEAEQTEVKTKTKNGKTTKVKTKVAKVKPVHYSGSKLIQETASQVVPAH